MRWASFAVCTFAVAALTAVTLGLGTGTAAAGTATATAASAHTTTSGAPELTLTAQTSSVTPAAPWFDLSLHVAARAGAPGSLHVDITFYSRLGDPSQMEQAVAGTPQKSVLTRLTGITLNPVPLGGAAAVCATVLPNANATAPTPAAGTVGACGASAPQVYLDCELGTGICGDVYPVSVDLYRQGDGTPLDRFTTFLTYQEPGAIGTGGQLRVALIAPVAGTSGPVMAAALAAHRQVPVTLAVSPLSVAAYLGHGNRAGHQALTELAALSNPAAGSNADEVPAEPYVPIDVAALAGSGLGDEAELQLTRGTQLLHQGGLHPVAGVWIDTASAFTVADTLNLATGLGDVRADQFVLSDGNLAPGGLDSSTFAQPFSLPLARLVHPGDALHRRPR
jgi:hypothetical protein